MTRALRFLFLIPALCLALVLLPLALLAGAFYLLALVFDHEPTPHYRNYRSF